MKRVFELVNDETWYDALVATACGECFLRVTSWKETSNSAPSVMVDIFSPHEAVYRQRFSQRLKRAFGILFNRYSDNFVEFVHENEVDRFIAALQKARKVAFQDG